MQKLASFAAALAAVGILVASSAPARSSQAKHSLSEFAYLIGNWHCIATRPDGKKLGYDTSFAWKYPSKTVIDQHIVVPNAQANFMLTYDKASDSFHGVFTDSTGGAGFWINPGPKNGGWSEYGYDINDLVNPNTRAIFYGITPTHYAFHFWSIKGKSDPGKPIESDECDKVS